MILSNKETHIIQLNTISSNREKSYWNSLNYRSDSLHRKAILSNFVVRTNVYRWFTDMFLWEFINRFANACKRLVAQLVTHDKSVGFVMLGNRLIIWRSQVQALAGPLKKEALIAENQAVSASLFLFLMSSVQFKSRELHFICSICLPLVYR